VNGVAEIVEPGKEALGLTGFGLSVEMVGAEIVIEGAVPEHVVGRGEDRGGDSGDRVFGATPGAQAMELRVADSCRFCGRPPKRIGSGWS
jgi:hypothetical protein